MTLVCLRRGLTRARRCKAAGAHRFYLLSTNMEREKENQRRGRHSASPATLCAAALPTYRRTDSVGRAAMPPEVLP
jgi:hypothetical protein